MKSISISCCSGILLGLLLMMYHAVARTPEVSLYMREDSGVLDLNWDNGPVNLEQQLWDLGLSVATHGEGQPTLAGPGAPDAYVIPFQHGSAFYASVEDMQDISAFVSNGGLVIILDAATGEGAAVRNFVSASMNYNGSWALCKSTSNSGLGRRFSRVRTPALSKLAPSFLRDTPSAGPWPSSLEDARVLSTLTWCHHEDADAVTLPLYSLGGDDMKVAVQAFGKVGVPGAVVWLGYSWRDGPQKQWGNLLKKVIYGFAEGAHEEAPVTTEPEPTHLFDMVDRSYEETALEAEQLATFVRRALTEPAVYPSLPPPVPDRNPTTNGNNGNGNGNNKGNGNGNNGNGNNGNGNNGNGNNGNGNNGNGFDSGSNGHGRGRELGDSSGGEEVANEAASPGTGLLGELIDDLVRRFLVTPAVYPPPTFPGRSGDGNGNKGHGNNGNVNGNNGNGNGNNGNVNGNSGNGNGNNGNVNGNNGNGNGNNDKGGRN